MTIFKNFSQAKHSTFLNVSNNKKKQFNLGIGRAMTLTCMTNMKLINKSYEERVYVYI